MLAIEDSASTFCARLMRGTMSMAMARALTPRTPAASARSGSGQGGDLDP